MFFTRHYTTAAAAADTTQANTILRYSHVMSAKISSLHQQSWKSRYLIWWIVKASASLPNFFDFIYYHLNSQPIVFFAWPQQYFLHTAIAFESSLFIVYMLPRGFSRLSLRFILRRFLSAAAITSYIVIRHYFVWFVPRLSRSNNVKFEDE